MNHKYDYLIGLIRSRASESECEKLFKKDGRWSLFERILMLTDHNPNINDTEEEANAIVNIMRGYFLGGIEA